MNLSRRTLLQSALFCSSVRAASCVGVPKRNVRAWVLIHLAGGASHIDTFDAKEGPWNPRAANLDEFAAGIVIPKLYFPLISSYVKRMCVIRSLRTSKVSHSVGSLNLLALSNNGENDKVIGLPLGLNIANRLSSIGHDATYLSINQPFLLPLLAQIKRPMCYSDGERSQCPSVAICSRQIEISAVLKMNDRDVLRYGSSDLGYALTAARNLITGFGGRCLISCSHGSFDLHEDMFCSAGHVNLCRRLDLGLSAFLEDLERSGELDNTLISIVTEFGRTPGPLNRLGGRHHYSDVCSAVLIGGGVRGGVAIGSTDDSGAQIVDTGWRFARPIELDDIGETVRNVLGVPSPALEPCRAGRGVDFVHGAANIQEALT